MPFTAKSSLMISGASRWDGRGQFQFNLRKRCLIVTVIVELFNMELMVAYKTGQSPRLADIVLRDDMHDIFFRNCPSRRASKRTKTVRTKR